MDALIDAHSPPPIAAASGGFSSSLLRRQRTSSSASSSSSPDSDHHHHQLPPRPVITSLDQPDRRSIVTASSSPVRRKPLPSNAAPVILSRLSQSSLPLSPPATGPLSPPLLPPLLPPQLPPPLPPRQLPPPAIAAPKTAAPPISLGHHALGSPRQLETVDEVLPFVPRDLDRYGLCSPFPFFTPVSISILHRLYLYLITRLSLFYTCMPSSSAFFCKKNKKISRLIRIGLAQLSPWPIALHPLSH
jgi:hypothetical protein